MQTNLKFVYLCLFKNGEMFLLKNMGKSVISTLGTCVSSWLHEEKNQTVHSRCGNKRTFSSTLYLMVEALSKSKTKGFKLLQRIFNSYKKSYIHALDDSCSLDNSSQLS